ncbi:flagellar basal body-associated FliL family protein [Acetivibrio ethanolgignens]|uniref:Uncharacterized protein n=1 Tax=Acetivibrio ethanolgignens TaxID=290052 RepID=A0A0V8QJM5_9FIRM|nr:flagellar basal body-associated FliL family protein [Acetivibrio ethanolgignens]KSV60686.1 hypothetical protein ASU35_00515 [Acetivibrio ethanolgignens]
MKKNMLTVVILALCLINLILTGTMVFVIVPTSQKTDKLITQVASVIELELKGDGQMYDITGAEPYKIEEKKQMNLAPGDDGKDHYAILDYVTVYVNPDSEKYKQYNTDLTAGTYNSVILDKVETVISGYSYEETVDGREQMKEDLLNELKKVFGSSDFIISVSFGNLLFS